MHGHSTEFLLNKKFIKIEVAYLFMPVVLKRFLAVIPMIARLSG